MSKLGFFNRFIFQLFFIRLTKHIKMGIVDDMFKEGLQPIKDENGEYVIDYWSIQYWILPFTGWGMPYIILTNDRKPRFLKL